MCGIVGFISGAKNGFTANERDAVRDLIYMDSMRGWDSTGLMYGTNGGAVQVHKEAKPGFAFLASNEWKSSSSELFSCGKWAVAHNRAATRGAKIDANAHPFYVQSDDKKRSIILLQNGTYKGDHTKHAKTDTDTEACAITLVNEPDVSVALKTINAAYVFVWYDVEEKTLNIIRNDERPLYITNTKNDGVIFCSEMGILLAACERNGVELKDKPYMLSPSCLCQYKFSGGDFTPSFKKLETAYEHPFVMPKMVEVGEATVLGPPFRPTQITSASHGNSSSTTTPGTGRVHRLPRGGVTNGSRHGLSLGDAMLLLKNEAVPMRGPEYVKAVSSAVVCARHTGESFLVEGFDYVKRDEYDMTDNAYYVFGTIMQADQDDVLNGHLVSWMVDAPEKQVLEYVSNNYFYMSMDYLVTRMHAGQSLLCIVAKDDSIEIVGNKVANEETTH